MPFDPSNSKDLQAKLPIPAKPIVWAALAAIFGLALWLRTDSLGKRDLWYWDEGYYILESRFYRSAVGLAPCVLKTVLNGGSLSEMKEEVAGWTPSTPKPLHTILLSPFSKPGQKNFLPQLLFTAVISSISVFLVFSVGNRVFGGWAGLLAAGLFAVSEYTTHFGRSIMAETDSTFFLLLGTALYLRTSDAGKGSKWRVFLAGLTLGLSVACNYRWMILFPFFLLLEVFPNWKRRPGESLFGSLSPLSALILAIGMAAPALAIQAPYTALKAIGALPPEIRTYFDILYNDFYNPSSNPHWMQIRPHGLYLGILARTEGLPVLAAAAIGFCWIVIRRKPAELLIAALAWALVIFFSIIRRGDNFRAIAVTLPFIQLTAAAVFVWGGSWLARRFSLSDRAAAGALTAILAALLAAGAVRAQTPIRFHGGYRQAAEWLETTGQPNNFSTMFTVFKAYMGREVSHRPPPEPEDLREAAKRLNIRWHVVEAKKFYEPLASNDWVESSCNLAKTFPNPQPTFWVMRLAYYNLPEANERLMHDETATQIRIYDLESCL